MYVFGKLRGRVLAGLSNVGGQVDNGSSSEKADSDNSECNGSIEKKEKEQEASSSEDEKLKQKPPQSTSKIFATSFDPELVCVGDVFKRIDDVAQSCGLLDGVGPTMVTFDDKGELLFERMEL